MNRFRFRGKGRIPTGRILVAAIFLWAAPFFFGSAPHAEEIGTLQSRAKAGEIDAQVILGKKYLRGDGVPENFTEAYRWFSGAADRGNPEAQYYLGQMYARGLGLLRDDVEAVRWYFLSAEQGYPGAQYELGEMYTSGRGVMHKEAEQGDAEGTYDLGTMYERGKGVPRASWRQCAFTGSRWSENLRRAGRTWKDWKRNTGSLRQRAFRRHACRG